MSATLKNRLCGGGAVLEPAQPPKPKPAEDPDTPLSRVPLGVRAELSAADHAAAAELRTRQRRGLLRQHALSQHHKPECDRFLSWADLFERGVIRSKTQARRLATSRTFCVFSQLS
jgi:hypothetical protein